MLPSQLRRNHCDGFCRCKRSPQNIQRFDEDDIGSNPGPLLFVILTVPHNLSHRSADFRIGKRSDQTAFDVKDRDADEGSRRREVETDDAKVFVPIVVGGERIGRDGNGSRGESDKRTE